MHVTRNIIANYAGAIWSSLMGFIFVPYYIRFMGIESYGLVGFCMSLWVLLLALDMGLSNTVVREMAALSASGENKQKTLDLVRTLEWVYWCVGGVTAAVLFLVSGWIARNWFNLGTLSVNTVSQAIIIIGLSLACRWPYSVYGGGLRGLQRQVLLNWIIAAVALLRGAGSVLILWLVSPTIQAFLLWRMGVEVFQTSITRFALGRVLQARNTTPRFQKSILVDILPFAAGFTATGIFFMVLTECDKIVLSKILPLEELGYYTFAAVAAGALLGLAYPVMTGLGPRLTECVARRDSQLVIDLYHSGAQILSVICIPSGIVLALFSKEILFAWTGEETIVEKSHMVFSLLVFGSCLCGILRTPHLAQIAHRWSSLGAKVNGISALVAIPLLVVLAKTYGVIGAALVWPLINVGQFVLSVPIMHRRILKGEALRWYLVDVAKPFVATLCVALPVRYAIPDTLGRLNSLLYFIVVLILCMAAAVLVAPDVRIRAFRVLRRARQLR